MLVREGKSPSRADTWTLAAGRKEHVASRATVSLARTGWWPPTILPGWHCSENSYGLDCHFQRCNPEAIRFTQRTEGVIRTRVTHLNWELWLPGGDKGWCHPWPAVSAGSSWKARVQIMRLIADPWQRRWGCWRCEPGWSWGVPPLRPHSDWSRQSLHGCWGHWQLSLSLPAQHPASLINITFQNLFILIKLLLILDL